MKTVIKSHVAWYIQHYIYTHLNPNSLKKKKKRQYIAYQPILGRTEHLLFIKTFLLLFYF